MSNVIEVEERRLQAAMNAIPVNVDERSYLMGVLFQVRGGEARLVAADGFIVIMQQFDCSPDGADAEFIIPVSTLKLMKPRGSKTEDRVCSIHYGSNQFSIHNADGAQFPFTPITEPYPAYEQFIPNITGQGDAGYLDPVLVGRMNTAVKQLNGKPKSMLIQHNGLNNGGRVVIIEDDSFLGILMPMVVRLEAITEPRIVPGWA